MNGRDKPSTAEDLFAHYLALRESGDGVPFERFVREHSDFQSELVQLAQGWDRFEDVFDGALKKASSSLFFRRGQPGERLRARDRMLSVGLRPNAVIGDFTLLRMLAEGGMGQVWEARQGSLDRRVALKFIRPDNTDPDAVFLFEREARAGGRLHHPCAVAVYATGESAGVRWIAQELVEGGYTLEDFLADLRREGALPPRYFEEVARFFLDVAEVLQAAHDAGVIHRDIKPSNVLISPDDRPKLTDFGLARLADDERRSDPLALRGTPHYMSPEQVTAKAVGPRAEVFSLGSMLYEVLTLRRPFTGKTRSEIFAAILRGDPAAPRAVDARVPLDLSVICAKALQSDPQDRYASMRELADDLRRFLGHEPILARPAGPVQRARKWVRRHPVSSVAALLGAALLLTTVSLAVTWLAGRAERRAFLRDQEIREVEFRVEVGDMEGALAHAREAMRLAPDDPGPHLVLAQGYAQFARLDESEREIKRAIELGFRTEPENLASARDHYRYALYVLATRKTAGFGEAEKHLARAAELDPALTGVFYPLYQVRSGLGDRKGALDAARRLHKSLRGDDEIYPVIDALVLELEERLPAAIDLLEGLLAQHAGDPELLASLHVHRNLGRCYLRAGELDRAEEELLQATAAFPDDGSSWTNLAGIELRRYERDPAAPESAARLEAAVDLARRGRRWDPDQPLSHRFEAIAAVASFGFGFGSDHFTPRSPAEWAAVEETVAALRAVAPDDPNLPRLTAHLDFLRALVAPSSAATQELLARCVATDRWHVPARALLGQEKWFDHDFRGALDDLEVALDTWRELERSYDPAEFRPRWPREWLLMIHVWTFSSASKLREIDTARSAREAAEREIAEAGPPDPVELLNYAEALAEAEDDELRDCARARGLLFDYDLARAIGPPADDTIAKILALCP